MLPWTSSAIDSRANSAHTHRSSRREMAPAPGNDAMGKVEGNGRGKQSRVGYLFTHAGASGLFDPPAF